MTSTEIKTIELIVNSEQAKKRLDELNTRLTTMKQKREEALNKGDSRGLQIYTKEIQKIEREIRNTESRANTLSRALGNLDKSAPNELKRTLRELQRELNSGRVQRGSEEWNTLTKAIRETKDAISDVNQEMSSTKSWSDRLSEFNNKWMGLVMNLQAVIQMFDSLRETLLGTVTDFANMEEAMAQVRKYTGMSSEEVADLNNELKKIDTRTSRERLNELAGDAGKLGITAKDKILEFVDAADKINVALGDDLGADAVKNIGKLAMMFGEDDRIGLRGAMLATGSVINELSQNSSASAGYLESFTARLSGVGKQARLSQADIMGFGAVLDENMQTAELASTAFSQLITKMFQDPAKFAALAGLEVKAFADLLKNDANEALLKFFSAMQAKGGFDALAPMFAEMGLNGVRATGVLSAVADKLDDVRKMQDLANQSYEEATSVQNEFNVQNTTVQAGLDKARKAVLEMRIELGEKLQPLATKMLNFTTLFLRWLSSTITFIGQHKIAIVTLGAAIAAYTVAVNAATIAAKAKAAAMVVVNGIAKAYTATVKALHAAHILLQLGLAKLQGNWAKQSLLMLDVKKIGSSLAMGWGILAAAAVTLTVAIVQTIKKLGELSVEEKELRKVREQAAGQIAEEKNKLELLTAVARDETRSLKDRQTAIAALNKIVPNYNGHLDVTTGKYRENKAALDDYINSLIHLYEIEGAKEELKRIGRQRAENKVKEAAARDDKSQATQTISKYYDPKSINSYVAYGTAGVSVAQGVSMTNGVVRSAEAVLRRSNGVLNEVARSNAELDKQERALIGAYGKELQDNALQEVRKPNGTPPKISGGGGTSSSGNSSGSGTGSNTNHTTNTTTEDPIKVAIDKLQAEARAARVAAQAEYQAGIINRRQYEEKLLIIESDMLEKQQKLYEQGTDDWNKLQEKRFEQTQKVFQKSNEWSLEEIERQELEEINQAKEKYAIGLLSEKEYQEERNRITLDYLQRRINYLQQVGDTESMYKYQVKYNEEDLRQQMERQKEFLQQAEKMKQEYMKKSLDEQEQEELALLKKLIEAGVIAKELEEQYKTEISKKYTKLRADEEKKKLDEDKKKKEEEDKKKGKIDKPLESAGGALDDWSQSFITMMQNLNSLQQKLKDGEASWQDYAAVATASLGMISALTSSFANLFSAEQRGEEQAIEKKYDKELEKAGNNQKKRKKIEEQKERELAKIKNKYNEKAMAMEIAQAVASTAMAAINAYASAAQIPFIGWKVAPIAAALALAAGAVQIAAIKKQHAAQQTGYYAGGFTSGTHYTKEAGIVHEGEFVANHKAVNNPQLLPVLKLIDHAQKNNTVARLTAEDVSRTLPGGALAVASAPLSISKQSTAQIAAAVPTIPQQPAQVQIIDSSSEQTAAALQRLNERLEQPIETFVTIDGPNGLHRQYSKYQKMLNRK